MNRHAHLPNWIVIVLGVFFLAPTTRSPLFAQEHKPDRHTLLLLHCNGDLSGAQNEKPVQSHGVAFESGIFKKGAYFAPGNQVYFSSAGNINSTEGTLEFWIKPRWNGNDGQGYVVLRFGVGGGMYFAKDGANNWRSIFNRFGVGNPEVGVAFNISAWQADQWHHAAFTWRSEALKLYVDGQLLNEFQVPVPLNVVNEPTFQLGADFSSYYLDAVIDELRISDIERSAQEIQASFLAAQSDPFTVTNTNDSGPGSLRQVILNANATPGRDVIRFKIPSSGPHTIQPLSALPTITDPVVIDGATQPGFAGKPIIELDGSSAGAVTNGLTITAGSSVVQAMVINRFSNSGIWLQTNGGNAIAGNYIGTNVTGTAALGNGFDGVTILDASGNTIGGTMPKARNVISGNKKRGVFIFISAGAATENQIKGNFIGTDVTGTVALGNSGYGVLIQDAPNNKIGGTIPGARNVISGNNFNGVGILGSGGSGATGNLVQGNFIGTDVTGTVALGNGNNGIDIGYASGNTIGGTMPGARNIISGNKAVGVFILGFGTLSTNNVVQGNLIGTDKNGSRAIPNGSFGVEIDNAINNIIGGTTVGARNAIAYNGRDGVRVNSGTGNAILSNSIFSNSGLGIDLNVDGVTLNDAGDGDTGANNLQNFPVLTSATRDDDDTIIKGTLNSTPNTTFRLEFFSNPACDPSNHGEGKKFLGSKKVTTDGSGNANFKASFDTKVAPGQLITATATDPSNNTSEFSQCIAVTASSSQAATAKADQNEIETAEENAGIPENFALFQNYPNPFNPETEIRFQLPQASHVVLKIFNTLGEEIRTLADEQREAGYHRVRWNGKDENGNAVASGVYLYQLRTGSYSEVRKMSLIR
ncbi:T9SS type A sorting domain-containing protein [candidate division KSB1 bacterium]|nr:T9SS type A sorting domain-containing protein [candidate division KSB1 bacterium]